MNLEAITRPTLILDKDRCIQNIDRIIERAKAGNTQLRPHFKTHQSSVIGEWFRERGIDRITVSSPQMAIYFAAFGWKDITIAFPFNVREVEVLDELAGKIELGILVTSLKHVEQLKAFQNPVNVWLKIDAGYGRSGLNWKREDAIAEILSEIKAQNKHRIKGLLTHPGHTYNVNSQEEIIGIERDAIVRLQNLRKKLPAEFSELLLSSGDTPGCSLLDDFSGLDEIRPGNLVFYDLFMHTLGVCDEADMAVVMACPVVEVHPEKGEVIVHGGGIHFSKDHLILEDGTKSYGGVCPINEKGWGKAYPNTFVKSLSQEHGIIHGEGDWINKIQPGDLIAILPVHSCMTANLMGRYYTLQDEWIHMMPR